MTNIERTVIMVSVNRVDLSLSGWLMTCARRVAI